TPDVLSGQVGRAVRPQYEAAGGRIETSSPRVLGAAKASRSLSSRELRRRIRERQARSLPAPRFGYGRSLERTFPCVNRIQLRIPRQANFYAIQTSHEQLDEALAGS